MKLYYPLEINLYQLWPLSIMTAQQYNVGRGAVITLTADAVVSLENEMVNLYAKRPDGNISYLPVRVEGTKIYCDFTEQMLSKAGRLQVELQMISGEESESTDITTPIFIVEVQPSNLNARAIEGSDEFIALRDALLKANSSIALAEKAAEDANAAASAAETAAGKVNAAVSSATSAASAANTAASSANSAASEASQAASSASLAAGAANAAAAAANEAAEKIPKLKPIATSGKASDVALDPIQGMEATDVQAALAEQYSKMGGLSFRHQALSGVTNEYSADNVLVFNGKQLYPGNFTNCAFFIVLNSSANISNGRVSIYVVIFGVSTTTPKLMLLNTGDAEVYPKLALTSSNHIYTAWSVQTQFAIYVNIFKLY